MLLRRSTGTNAGGRRGSGGASSLRSHPVACGSDSDDSDSAAPYTEAQPLSGAGAAGAAPPEAPASSTGGTSSLALPCAQGPGVLGGAGSRGSEAGDALKDGASGAEVLERLSEPLSWQEEYGRLQRALITHPRLVSSSALSLHKINFLQLPRGFDAAKMRALFSPFTMLTKVCVCAPPRKRALMCTRPCALRQMIPSASC